MPISCDWRNLLDSASGYLSLSPEVRRAIRLYSWCKLLNEETIVCDPKKLASASTPFWSCLTPPQFDAIETMFSCLSVNSGGGGGGGGGSQGPPGPAGPAGPTGPTGPQGPAGSASGQVFSGHYSGGTPTQTPTGSSAIAYDLDSPSNQWVWNGSAWV